MGSTYDFSIYDTSLGINYVASTRRVCISKRRKPREKIVVPLLKTKILSMFFEELRYQLNQIRGGLANLCRT
jgi:hypothetical protein